jgi:hypothetical protein
MDMKTVLPWGQPWYFLFKEKLDPQEEKKAMGDVGTNLYNYIERSLGSKNFFTLQLKWSRMVEYEAFCILDAILIVTREGVTEWEKRNAASLLDKDFEFREANEIPIGRDATKPPPPPPPPPFPAQLSDILNNPGPLHYLSNLFTLSHVLGFTENGRIYQFNERPLGQTH